MKTIPNSECIIHTLRLWSDITRGNQAIANNNPIELVFVYTFIKTAFAIALWIFVFSASVGGSPSSKTLTAG